MVTMVRGTALIPQRFWEVIKVETQEEIDSALSRGFYIYKGKINNVEQEYLIKEKICQKE
jgi:hypothetical protein